MNRFLWIALGIISFISGPAAAETLQLPDFLPDYYAPAFSAAGVEVHLADHSETNGIKQWRYSSTGQSLGISIEFVQADSAQSKIVFTNVLRHLTQPTPRQKAEVKELAERDAYLITSDSKVARRHCVFRTPDGVQIWTFSSTPLYTFQADPFEQLRFAVSRERYLRAYQEGNVGMGHWGNEIYDYASALLERGEKSEAVTVLSRLIATSPYHAQAHMDFVRHTSDHSAAVNSAEIVANNAEDEALIAQAESFLQRTPPALDSFPKLTPEERGLQVILIPLPPCSARVIKESAEIYQEMTDIPVKISRLPEEWSWSTPERFAGQRNIERLLARPNDKPIDFSGWTKDRYAEELRSIAKKAGALNAYYVEELIAKMENEPGQYEADTYLTQLCRMLEKYAAPDQRTMYIGVTEANIFSDGNNFLFSLGRTQGHPRASLLSYHMMQASVLNEAYAFRPRLTERLAKEMVPASLKQLAIPRSTDPRCPYSYSSGISRLDEKTRTLSKPLKAALQQLKNQPDEL